jgi:tetratricopeptide (TPR) repeat protein
MMRSEEGSDGTMRFTMLETIREYALELLTAHGELAAAREHQARYMLAEVEAVEAILGWGVGQAAALAHMTAEMHNIRAALSWSLDPQHADRASAAGVGLRLNGALASYYIWRGSIAEGCGWFEHLEGHIAHVALDARAKALLGAGSLYGFVDASRAVRYCEESVAAYRALGEHLKSAQALHWLGRALRNGGNPIVAEAVVQEALTLFRALGRSEDITWVLLHLGDCAQDRGEYAHAQQLLQEALTLSGHTGDVMGEGYILANLGRVAHALGQDEQAASLLEQGIAVLERLDAPGGPEGVRESLAYVLAAMGEYRRAARMFADTLIYWWEHGSPYHIPLVLEGIATIAAEQGEAVRAVRLFGAAEALREILSFTVRQIVRADYERGVAAARDVLSSEAFERAWEAGRQFSLVEAVEDGLQYTELVKPDNHK